MRIGLVKRSGEIMKCKKMAVVLCILFIITLSGCAKEGIAKNTIEGNVQTYYEMTDGTWMCDDQTYKYRLDISGRMPNAANDSNFVFLSNIEEITFEQAYNQLISSNSEDFFSPEEAVLVEMN